MGASEIQNIDEANSKYKEGDDKSKRVDLKKGDILL